MAKAEFRDVLSVSKEKLFSAITRYEDYPDFIEGCTSVSVDRKKKGEAHVDYHLNMMSQEITYTLEHAESLEAGRVEWHLVESNLFKKNDGRWEIRAIDENKTEVVYSLELEFKIPVPGFILNRLVKGSLPGMVKSFEKKAIES